MDLAELELHQISDKYKHVCINKGFLVLHSLKLMLPNGWVYKSG